MDLRLNKNAYNETYKLFKQDKQNAKGSRLKWNATASAIFKAKIYREMESNADEINNTYQIVQQTLIIKTVDRLSVEINDKVQDVNTGKFYIVTSISRDTNKSRFIGRYDKFKSCDTYITLRG